MLLFCITYGWRRNIDLLLLLLFLLLASVRLPLNAAPLNILKYFDSQLRSGSGTFLIWNPG